MTTTQWQYLESRPHPWRKQLYIKGKRIKANVIYSDMIVNKETPTEAASNWDLPLTAIEEVIKYCQTHQQLLRQEAQEERRIVLVEGGQIKVSATSSEVNPMRVPGIDEGRFVVPDDFDDPLPFDILKAFSGEGEA